MLGKCSENSTTAERMCVKRSYRSQNCVRSRRCFSEDFMALPCLSTSVKSDANEQLGVNAKGEFENIQFSRVLAL